MQIFGDGELFPADVREFNSTLTQLMSEYQRQRLKEHQMQTHDFIYERQDDQGVKHSFFDFHKFSNFIEEDEDIDGVVPPTSVTIGATKRKTK